MTCEKSHFDKKTMSLKKQQNPTVKVQQMLPLKNKAAPAHMRKTMEYIMFLYSTHMLKKVRSLPGNKYSLYWLSTDSKGDTSKLHDASLVPTIREE